MSRAVMQQALEALEWNYNNDLDNIPACEQWAKMLNETITALRAALAEPEQEPCAMRYDFDGYGYKYIDSGSGSNWQTRHKDAEPLFTAPTPRRPLTDEEIWNTYKNLWMFHPAEEPRLAGDVLKFARAIERAHGIGGGE